MFEPVLSSGITLTLDRAFHAHHQWKRQLQEAAAKGTQLDIASIQRDDLCELGQWLHGEGRKLYGNRPEFKDLLAIHAEFHAVTALVADIINHKHYEHAHSHLEGSSQFSSASTDVGLAILRLKTAAVQLQGTLAP